MLRSCLVLPLVLTTGCKVYDPLYCDETRRCTDPERPFCDLEGEYPASEGIAKTCIPTPGPPDAGSTDAGSTDGDPPDAASDRDARGATYPEPHVYWAFDKDDLSGSIVAARVGALSGVVRGTTVGAGMAGDAFVFDGGDDHVDLGDVLDDVFAGPDRTFTISLWIRPTSIAGENTILVKSSPPTCDNLTELSRQVALVLLDGTPTLRFWTPANRNARYVAGLTPLVLDLWQHLLVTYDGAVDSGAVDRVRLYVDGVPQPLIQSSRIGTFPFDIEPTDSHTTLGTVVDLRAEPCSVAQLDADLDELAIWNSVLEPGDAVELHDRGAAGMRLWP